MANLGNTASSETGGFTYDYNQGFQIKPIGLPIPPFKPLWPTETYTITQTYSAYHQGLDISNSQNLKVFAVEYGIVSIKQDDGYGNYILINHINGYTTMYAHLSEILVKEGDVVQPGEVIGIQGNTGRTRGKTGIHLHFEVFKDGVRYNPLIWLHSLLI